MGMAGGLQAARHSASARGSALRLLPSIALSSAQVIGHSSIHPFGVEFYSIVGVYGDGMAGPSASPGSELTEESAGRVRQVSVDA